MRGETRPNVFVETLLASPLPIIMEVKRQDADGLALMGDRTIPEVVDAYTKAGAPCISVVTGKWFGGVDQMLVDVAALTDKPLLKKDFITREKQLVEAREMGASAVLLTAKILPKTSLPKVIEMALANDLVPFVEIVDRDELERVIHPERCIVAVNNKDIKGQERDSGDIDVSRDLLGAVIDSGTPAPVSASAITDPRVAAELIDAGFKGLLVGTGLLQAPSIQGWVDEFERQRAELAAGSAVGQETT